MLLVYMDNFRGFSDTIVPLDRVNFLVGENSSGKSSFMKLLYMLHEDSFWFDLNIPQNVDAELGNFNDIVSAHSNDKTYFRIGYLDIDTTKDGALQFEFASLKYKNHRGRPQISEYITYIDGQLTTLVFSKQRIKYKTDYLNKKYKSIRSVSRLFKDCVSGEMHSKSSFTKVQDDLFTGIPIPFLVSYIRIEFHGQSKKKLKSKTILPRMEDLIWMAPIRTKPQRIYDGSKTSYSPGGDHIPHILRSTLKTKTSSIEFSNKLSEFGKASGLYEVITTHSFSKSAQSPFEIMVKFSGAKLNINNVGYGVSQVLPLVVEFLAKQHSSLFAVQQPEVHLHPCAQAAFGDLLAQLVIEKGHGFIVETHSDYLIDRYRLSLSRQNINDVGSQVLFFERSNKGNTVTSIAIDETGRYSDKQPKSFRDFFIKEQLELLGI